jgi:hypothetical protein
MSSSLQQGGQAAFAPCIWLHHFMVTTRAITLSYFHTSHQVREDQLRVLGSLPRHNKLANRSSWGTVSRFSLKLSAFRLGQDHAFFVILSDTR